MSENDSLDLTYAEGHSDTILFAIGAILAALYGVGSLIPISVFLGATATISLTLLIAPLFGILLGPWKGSFFGLVGGLTAFVIGGSGGLYQLIPFLFLSPAISGLLTGLVAHPKQGDIRFPGGLFTAAYLSIIIVLYEVVNYEGWWFMLYYMVAVVVALVVQITGIELRFEEVRDNRITKLVLFAIIGTMTDFSLMTMGAVYIMGLEPLLFGFVIFPAMLIERTAAIIISVIITTAVIKAFPEVWGSNQVPSKSAS